MSIFLKNILPNVNNNCLCLVGFQGNLLLKASSFCFSGLSYFVCNDHIIVKKSECGRCSLRKSVLWSDEENRGVFKVLLINNVLLEKTCLCVGREGGLTCRKDRPGTTSEILMLRIHVLRNWRQSIQKAFSPCTTACSQTEASTRTLYISH